MFLSFAMVWVTFVLMGYVSYLRKLEVDTVKRITELEGELGGRAQLIPPENTVDIYLHGSVNDISLTINDDIKSKYSHEELAELLNGMAVNFKSGAVEFNIHAPGELYHKYVVETLAIIQETVVLDNRFKKKLNLVYDPNQEEL